MKPQKSKALCLFVFLAVFSSLAVCTYPLYAEPSIAQQRQDVIQRAQNDLIDIQTKLNEKVQEQAKAGDKAGARNTQLRLQAAKDLSAMLRADSQAGGDIFKVRLIESYAGILNADFSSMGVREAMNYRRIGPDQLYDATHITEARDDIQSDRTDFMVLKAMQDRAIYFASQATYEDMHAGFQRGMADVALALNDTFADINPATSLLEAAIGTKVSGEEIGQEMSGWDRVKSAGKFVIEFFVDLGTDKITRDATKGIGTKVGPGRGTGDASGSKGPSLKGAADDAPALQTPSAPKGEQVIGHVNLNDVNNLDDVLPFTGLDNFNIDLRTGKVTTSSNPGGRLSPADQAKIEQGLQAPAAKSSKADAQGTAATAVVKPPVQEGEQVIGYVDLDNVNDVFDMAGFTNLENFNVDLRTGRVTTSNAQGGRIPVSEHGVIEAGLKPQGPLGGSQKIDMRVQNQTTGVDAHGQTTVVDKADPSQGVFNPNFSDPSMPPVQGPRNELKPIWDLLDLPPEQSKSVPRPKPSFVVVLFTDDPQGGQVAVNLDIFNDGFETGNVEEWAGGASPHNAGTYVPPALPGPGSADPFGDCFGPSCEPPFGGPVQPLGTPPPGADFHSSDGGPGSQFVNQDDLLNDPVFFDQRFGELFQGAPPSRDPHDMPN